jgi:hypothetical protein
MGTSLKLSASLIAGATLKLLGLIPSAELCTLFYGPKLVGHSNFSNLQRALVGLKEP